jgi:hypothetical protein
VAGVLVGPAWDGVVEARPARSSPAHDRAVVVASGRFDISIPTSWMALELSHATPPDVDAEFAAQVADARQVPHAIFFAAAPGDGDSLVVQSFPRMRSLDWGPLRRELRRLRFQNLTPQRGRVAGKRAIVVHAALHGVVDETFLTFSFVGGERGVIGFAFIADREWRRNAVARRILRSVRLWP